MEEKVKRRVITGSLTSVLIILGFILFRIFSVSTQSVLSYPITFFKNFISLSASSGTSDAILNSVASPLIYLIPFIPITIAFCILVFYGVNFGEDRRLGLLSCLISSVIGMIIVGPSLTSLIFALSIMICGALITPLSVMYLEELKKWKKYRIGSKTIDKCFLLINLLLLFALFLNVFFEIEYYNDIYTNETKEIVIEMVPDIGGDEMLQAEGFELMPPEQQEEIREEYSKLTESQKDVINSRIEDMFESGNISVLINLSIFLMPLMVFAFLELLRIIILIPMAGLITRITLTEVKS